MSNPRLSILIPSIPSRFDRANALYRKIEAMCEGMDIEVLMFTDNKKRTIGEKRDALKNMSNGDYFMFVDDDDDLIDVRELYEATLQDVDVITFQQRARNNNGSSYIVTFGLGNPIEHKTDEQGNYYDILRPPFHVCCWNKKFKAYKFPSVNYGEDWGWVSQFIELATTEIHIPKIIHSYNFDINVSEASTDDNEIWTNPNKYDEEVYSEPINPSIQSGEDEVVE